MFTINILEQLSLNYENYENVCHPRLEVRIRRLRP